MMISEPIVTLTDYGLTVECAVLAWLMGRRAGGPAREWFTLFFLSLGAAALTGGTVHGFFPDPTSVGHRLLWPTALLAIGVMAWAAWSAGGALAFAPAAARGISIAAGILFVVYAALVLLVSQDFAGAIIEYLPAALFLLAVFGWKAARSGVRGAWAGMAGLVLSFLAAAVQQLRIAPDPARFDHNALYHVLQAVALILIYRGAAALVIPETHHG